MGQTGLDRLGFMVGYTFSRLGLLLSLAAFGTFFGAVLLPSAAKLLPVSMAEVSRVIEGPVFAPAAGMAVVCILLVIAFREDGIGGTVCDDRSIVMILGALITVGMMYLAPAVLRDYIDLTELGEMLFGMIYYTAGWLSGTGAVSFTVAVLISDLVMLGASFAAYVVSYKRHLGRRFLVCVRDK